MHTVRRLIYLLALFFGTVVLSAQFTPIPQSNRIPDNPDLRPTTPLTGHIPSWATAANDAGPVAQDQEARLSIVLARSPGREAAFTHLLKDQQDPHSPRYHQWLTPQQVGDQYGPTQHDLDALTAWLTVQGFHLVDLAPSHLFITVSAPIATVSHALSTSFRSFRWNGQTRRAATTEPSIPTAFAPLVRSISGLADQPIEPMGRAHAMAMPKAGTTLSPDLTLTSTGEHFVTPGDFATIFDINPVYSAGINGAGQKIAIIGRSRVATTDISEFETNTGLAANLPNVVIPTTGVDPGITNDGDQLEATLDVVRVVGTAPGAQADLVVSGSAGNYDGIYIAAQYEVQTLLDPVMNISFGACEVYAGPARVALWDTLFAQAASRGISVFVSAADSGAATCDPQFEPTPAYQFRSINYICASSYATCVGATEFADQNKSDTYWSPTNTSVGVSALGYIPEGAWNEPVQNGSESANTIYIASSGGGGASIFVPKPDWQTGSGVPADGVRDVPDISFPGAAHDGYYACYSAGGGDCANGYFVYFAGTSAAAPTMAAVTALLNQKTNSSQGNINPLLYRLAASAPTAFHDTTPASSAVFNCDVNQPSMCNNSLPAPTSLLGGLAGFALTTGYDQATGLGSLDIANFIAAASAPTSASLPATTLTITASAPTISKTQTATFAATLTSKTAGTPSGTVRFFANAIPLGAPVTLASGNAHHPR